MDVRLYLFSKRKNSTKQPDITGGTLYSMNLKDDTSVYAPVMTLAVASLPLPTVSPALTYNYAYISKFQRFYFVRDWKYKGNIWEVEMVCDVMASFKVAIGSMSEYILRSSNTSNGAITDSMYPMTTQVGTVVDLLDDMYVRAYTAGFFVVGIIGAETEAAAGAITYYQLTATQMARLRAYMLSRTFLTEQGWTGTSILDSYIPAEAVTFFANPFQYIASCMWFPFPATIIPAEFKTSVQVIKFGWWIPSTSIPGYRIHENCPVGVVSITKTITDHPQISRGSYLNRSPYTERRIHIQPFGDIPINDSVFDSGDHIKCQLNVDFISGQGVLSIYSENSSNVTRMLLFRTCQMIGVDIQLAQITKDYAGEALDTTGRNATIASTFSSLLSPGILAGGGSLYGGITSAISATNKLMSSYTPQVATSGHNGSIADYAQPLYMTTVFHYIVNEDNAQLGRPLCEVRTISSIPGFIQVNHADVSLVAFDQERTQIKEYMEAGFFYE